MLHKEDIEELKELLRHEYGYEHTDRETEEIGTRLLTLYELLTDPKLAPASLSDRREELDRQALAYLHEEIVHKGHSPSVREFCHAIGFRSSRSGVRILERLTRGGLISRREDSKLSLHENYCSCVERHMAIQAVVCVLRLYVEKRVEGNP